MWGGGGQLATVRACAHPRGRPAGGSLVTAVSSGDHCMCKRSGSTRNARHMLHYLIVVSTLKKQVLHHGTWHVSQF